ncbi:hypothetical protein KYK29_20785 [Shinella daejeonensis]|uniref:hypothetical protein n=1 Tax=Shinella daejeonensis TaxID=659017 RepID=UPI0020C8044F|nr:hypothetical protein [Shinella daejeonensis]MCP8897371.1 hypothetical protein [Shinella daejeonensis]
MTEPERKFAIKLSPNVRLRMTFEREMLLDDDGTVFNDTLHQKYLEMHSRTLAKQEALLKTALLSDGLLALLLFGKNVTIPGTSIGFQDLPAAVEVLTVFASFSFMVLSLAFMNAQAYQAICEQFTIRLAAKKGIDPDFISSAYTSTELYIKLFRPKMNIFGEDFFVAGRGYKAFYSSLSVLLSMAMLSVLLLHMSVVGYGVWKSLAFNWISILFCLSVSLMNLAAILVNVAPSFDFTVKQEAPKQSD